MTGRLVVHEIFTSIQGESTHAGRPCTFIRLTGCNLRCVWCDTEYAFHGGREMDLEEILGEVRGRKASFVTLTGGEPLLQEGSAPLIARLLDEGFEVQVETSGAAATSGLDPRARVILDVKAPGSGEEARNDWSNLERLRPGDEVKIVILHREDYEYARELLSEGRIPEGVPVLFSPAHGRMDPAELARWILEDGLEARLQIQVHKVVWGSDARGV